MDQHLKEKEYDILCVLKRSNKPMTVTEIVKADESYTVNSVQAILRKMIQLKLVEVADIVYSRNVLARTFKCSNRANDIMQKLFIEDVKQYIKVVPLEQLSAALLKYQEKLEKKKTLFS